MATMAASNHQSEARQWFDIDARSLLLANDYIHQSLGHHNYLHDLVARDD